MATHYKEWKIQWTLMTCCIAQDELKLPPRAGLCGGYKAQIFENVSVRWEENIFKGPR